MTGILSFCTVAYSDGKRDGVASKPSWRIQQAPRNGCHETVRSYNSAHYFYRNLAVVLNHVVACRLMSDWKVELVNDSTRELEVDFEGPPGSAPSIPKDALVLLLRVVRVK